MERDFRIRMDIFKGTEIKINQAKMGILFSTCVWPVVSLSFL